MTVMYFDVLDRDVTRALDNLIALMSPAGMMTFLHTEIGPYLSHRAGERFANEGDDAVGQWQQLEPATQMIRAASNYPVGPDHPINRRSGELENWVVRGGWDAYPSGWGATLQYPKNQPTGELRDKVETAQRGLANPSTPPRPVLAVNETDLLFTTAALAFAVSEAAK